MSYVRIVDMEINKDTADIPRKLNDILEGRINAVMCSEHPNVAIDVKILSTTESSVLNTVTYKVLILFNRKGA
jgi:hypothetical protein